MNKSKIKNRNNTKLFKYKIQNHLGFVPNFQV